MDKNKVINFDFQGWPVEKMCIRDIIKGFGGTFNEKTKKWEITESELLDIYPISVEDDGMGYGVNEQYIIECSINSEHKTCYMFRENEINFPMIWLETGVTPGSFIKIDDKEWMPIEVNKSDNGFVFQLMEFNSEKFKDKSQEYKTISADDLKAIVNR